ncbi:hypothetical protein [Mesorhizobium sp. CAU 1741]|uniref:hypothetical protein n=1 Tax=Mesorhizobium sp. CAU 1741 TaxID=3140366 RepID=UPI00325AF39A
MSNNGVFNLGDAAITVAATDLVITTGSSAAGAAQAMIDRLDGMQGVSLQASFVYGSGGTSVAAVMQTSLDQGASWIDVCRFDFTTANAKKVANVSASAAAAPAAVAALGAEGKLDGVLGDRLRCKVTSVGTYGGNTTISIRAAVR